MVAAAVQRALVQEHAVKSLSGPIANKHDRSIHLGDGRSVRAAGMELAHWEAVKFLTRFAAECGSFVQLTKSEQSEARVAALQARCRSASHMSPGQTHLRDDDRHTSVVCHLDSA